MPRTKLFMRRLLFCLWVVSVPFLLQAEEQEDYKILREIIQNEFQKDVPIEQGSQLAAPLRRFQTTEKKIALVFGACLDQGADLDEALLKEVVEKKIPVSLFLDQGWLKKNSDKIKSLLISETLTLENHGLFCRPLSVTGKGAKEHPGTANVEEAFEEVEKNAREIEIFSGRLPRFYKSGYGFYDDVALKIVTVLGYGVIEGDLKLKSSDVASDETLKSFVEKIQPGSILVIPANRPHTANVWLPQLLRKIAERGYQIIALDEAVSVEGDKI